MAIHEVFVALRDAIILVLIVVFIFLGNIRATFIPMLAVPVSLVGTFAVFSVTGFSINTLTMLAIVLAVGIVVDDAIVVVEAVEHHIQHGLSPMAATEKAMDEVSGPVVAIGLVLCAVFVPVSFMGGIVGQLYKQFAITISISVILSVIVALTLTPALCQMLLKPRKEMRGPVGAFLRRFNKIFDKTTNGYLHGVKFFIRRAVIGVACLAGLWFGAGSLLMSLPTGFVPNEDQGYFFTVFNLPDGASMERTDQLMKRAEADLKTIPGVQEVLTTGGLNLLTNAYTSNNASIITMLKPWEERKSKEEQLKAILAAATAKFRAYPEAITLVFPPPAISGLGNASGFVFELQDRVGRTPQELSDAKVKMMEAMAKEPKLTGIYSGYSTAIPQIKLDIDRDKARTLNIPVNNVFQGLQIYLGGLQVNDFNLFGRTYKVMIQAEQDFRKSPESINDIYVRSSDNSMVPMSTVSKISMMTGPDILQRYNMFRTAEINGANGPGISTGAALTVMEDLAAKELPQGYGFEWTSIAYQEKEAGGSQGPIFAMAMIFVFLVLAAQYESWAVPFSVLLGLPIGVFGSLSRRDNGGAGEQRVCSDRYCGADGAGGEERDSDCGIRQREPRKGNGLGGGGIRGREASLPADHDDGARLHPRCDSAGDRQRRRRSGSHQYRNRGVRGYVVCVHRRPVLHSDALRSDPGRRLSGGGQQEGDRGDWWSPSPQCKEDTINASP